MNIESKNKTVIANAYYVVIIHDFFGPQEAKARLVKAQTEEEAKVKTRMGNPDLIKGFANKEDACAFLDGDSGEQWSEIEDSI